MGLFGLSLSKAFKYVKLRRMKEEESSQEPVARSQGRSSEFPVPSSEKEVQSSMFIETHAPYMLNL